MGDEYDTVAPSIQDVENALERMRGTDSPAEAMRNVMSEGGSWQDPVDEKPLLSHQPINELPNYGFLPAGLLTVGDLARRVETDMAVRYELEADINELERRLLEAQRIQQDTVNAMSVLSNDTESRIQISDQIAAHARQAHKGIQARYEDFVVAVGLPRNSVETGMATHTDIIESIHDMI